MLSSFETRLTTLLKKLDAAPACDSVEAAFALLHVQWLAANTEHESPASTMDYLRKRRLCAEHGWQGLGTEVCYADSSEMPNTRFHLHSDGTIVIQRTEPGSSIILFNKPGRRRSATPVAQTNL